MAFARSKAACASTTSHRLGHTIVAQRQRLIAGGVSKRLPGIPLERLANDLRHDLEGAGIRVIKPSWARWTAWSSPESVAWATSERGGGALKARLNASARCWNTWGAEVLPSQRLLSTGDATVLRHQQCQHRLLQGGTVILGGAVGKAPWRARRSQGPYSPVSEKRVVVKMIAAQSKDLLCAADRQRQCLQQQVAARGRGGIQGAAKLATVAHAGADPANMIDYPAQHWD